MIRVKSCHFLCLLLLLLGGRAMAWTPPEEAVETFESQGFTTYPWFMSGNAPWQIQNTNPYAGTYCAASGSIGDGEKSQIKLNLNVSVNGTLRFAKRVSSEQGFDYLRFYVDGVEMGRWSGTLPWSESVFTISAGFHQLSWSYEKDGATASGQDRAWIDNIVLPPFQIAVATKQEVQMTEASPVSIFPNPAADYVRVRINISDNAEPDLRLFDGNGRLCRSFPAPKLSPGIQDFVLDLRLLPPGVYLLQIALPEETRRLLLQRL